MIIVALTGSIGMGKSTTAAMFADEGVPVWDADAAVHRLYGPGGAAVQALLDRFADVGTLEDGIDRQRLGAAVLGNLDALKALEAIVHPLVGQDRAAHLAEWRAVGHAIGLVDVPLLYETGGERFVDAVVLVSCPPDVQRARVLARPGMSAAKLEAILARQMPDADKRARADFIIETGDGIDRAREQVRHVLAELRVRAGKREAPSPSTSGGSGHA